MINFTLLFNSYLYKYKVIYPKVIDDYENSKHIDLNTDKRLYKICCNMYCLIGGDYCCYCTNDNKNNKMCNNCKSKGQICCNKTNWKILN